MLRNAALVTGFPAEDSLKMQDQADMASSIVVASGKGGVGKTSLAVNLGLTLARQGRRTVLLDADFGMANAHILIGANPQRFVMDAIQGDASMADVLCDAPHGMKFISGGSGLLGSEPRTDGEVEIRMVDSFATRQRSLLPMFRRAHRTFHRLRRRRPRRRCSCRRADKPRCLFAIKAANLEADVRHSRLS